MGLRQERVGGPFLEGEQIGFDRTGKGGSCLNCVPDRVENPCREKIKKASFGIKTGGEVIADGLGDLERFPGLQFFSFIIGVELNQEDRGQFQAEMLGVGEPTSVGGKDRIADFPNPRGIKLESSSAGKVDQVQFHPAGSEHQMRKSGRTDHLLDSTNRECIGFFRLFRRIQGKHIKPFLSALNGSRFVFFLRSRII